MLLPLYFEFLYVIIYLLIKKAINCSECKMVPDVLIYEYQTSKFRISCSSCSKCTSSAKTINRAIKKWNKLNKKK